MASQLPNYASHRDYVTYKSCLGIVKMHHITGRFICETVRFVLAKIESYLLKCGRSNADRNAPTNSEDWAVNMTAKNSLNPTMRFG